MDRQTNKLPNNAPIANPASPFFAFDIAAMALKMSGAPLPNAKNVTPYIKAVKNYKDRDYFVK